MILAVLRAAATAVAIFTAPAQPSPQPVTVAASPQVHAWYEYEYARDASYASLSPQHQEQVLKIANAFNKGRLSEDDAAARINALLTPPEEISVTQIQSSFWSALHAVFPGGKGQHDTLLDPGTFILILLASPDATTAAH